MRHKKSRTAALFLAASLAFSAAFGAAAPARANVKEIQDPRVTSATVTPAAPGVGSPFDVDLTFTQTFDTKGSDSSQIFNALNISEARYAVFDIGAETGSVSVSKSDFSAKIETSNSDDDDSYPEDTGIVTYHLYLPQRYLKRMGSGYGVLKFKITYCEDAKGNDVVTYDNNKVPSYTVEYLVFSKLDSSSDTEDQGQLTVSSYKLDHSPVREGETFGLTLTVKNTGSAACANVLSVLDLSGAEGVSIRGETDTKTLGNLSPGASATVNYPLACLSKMETGSYPVGISLSADDTDKSASKIYLPITGTKTGKDDTGEVGDSKPQLIIESYDFGGKAVTGGQEFNLVMNVRNTGSAAIDNCKMTVGSDTGDSDSDKAPTTGSVFTPSQSSNTFFIPKLSAGATVKKTIALLPKADAAPNSYGVIVNFSYDAVVDGKRQTLTSQETITIPLSQPIRFEIGEPALSSPFFAGEAGQVSVDYVNKGKSKVYNVSVELAGNFGTEEGAQYIGNVDSGASDTLQAALTPQKEGTLSGTATFNYEDASGKVTTVVKKFSTEVQAAEVPAAGGPDGVNPDGTPGTGPQKGGSGWKLWAGVAAGVIAIAAGTAVFLKKRKAKKLRLLEESDDYDEPGGGA
ncbi:hypothetical protein EQM14_04280 [Caproiciproducens sp. NJN-50]|uniref:COG1361 S-layer family protein n=1 Tax=Acutalibacteraceae TaxID=3082771 RepID=UPI000FFE149B|nr:MULTISPECIES: hypothetical protein [Acutalibacteraceae]QAT49053.1 hypothetical protein EQM14_04280 [Caproiciproducens sp. NJN-50]